MSLRHTWSSVRLGNRGRMLNIIAAYFETDISRAAALDQMHLLAIQLPGKSAKDLQNFVRKTNYVLHGLRATDRPAEATMPVVVEAGQEGSDLATCD